MMRRCWIVGTLALWAAASGCTGTAMRNGTSMASRQRAWADAPAPPQRQVMLPSGSDDAKVAAGSPAGLSKYFPGLSRSGADAPGVVATKTRPSRFGFARRAKPNQIYTTDARAGLDGGMVEASALPVAIQLPTENLSDRAVTPTHAEAPLAQSEPPKPEGPADAQSSSPELGVADAETSPTVPVVANRMPGVPAANPVGVASSASSVTPSKAIEPEKEPTGSPQPDAETAKAAPAPAPAAAPVCPAPTPDRSEPTILTSFFRRKASASRPVPHVHATTALTSPQSGLPQAGTTPQAKRSPPVQSASQVQPTPQVKPSSQAAGSCVAETSGAQGCQHCCLRSMVGKLCRLIKHKSGASTAGH